MRERERESEREREEWTCVVYDVHFSIHRCSVLQRVAVFGSVLHCDAIRCSALQRVALSWSALQCEIICVQYTHAHACSVLQRAKHSQ